MHPALGLLALVVCGISAVAGVRAGVALALVAIAELAVLAFLEIRTGPGPIAAPLPLMILLQCLIIGTGLAGGVLAARVVSHYLRAAADRERRSRDLFNLAADFYWEQDRDFRFTHAYDPRGLIDPRDLQAHVGGVLPGRWPRSA